MTLSSELDLDSLLQRVADLAREVVGASYAAVGVLRDEGMLARFVFSGLSREQANEIGDLPEGRGVLGALIEEGRPLRLHQISDHPRSYGFPEHHPPMRTFLGVPIVVRGHVYGRLYLTEKEGGSDFTKDDERIALTLASQAGIAIENAHLYEEIRARSGELARRIQEMSSVERLGDLLISGTSITDILHSTVQEAVQLTGATQSALSLAETGSGDLVIRSALGPSADALIGLRLEAGTAKAHAVMARLKGEIAEDLTSDPEMHESTLAKLGRPRTGAFVPLVIDERAIGVLAVYGRETGESFSDDDLTILQILANQAAIALENDRLTVALRDLAVLEERERISKELHDGVIQSIYSVGLSLQGSLSLLERDTESSRKRIDAAIAELDNVVRNVRSYIFELRPRLELERGFAETVRELARDLEVNTLASAHVDLDSGACAALEESAEAHVVQIVREILSNIARHAQATEVGVVCRRVDGAVELEITDNGLGFDPSLVKRGHGLTNIEDRARQLGGTVAITSLEPQGTIHTLRLPLEEGS